MRILFLCLGNICRSPAAEGVFRDMAAKAGLSVELDSAGTGGWHTGSAPYGRFATAETTASLELPLELGGKRSARIAVADARTDRATIQASIAQADLRLNVIRAYAEAASAEELAAALAQRA